jgi:transcription-repair coupling factor (superfamily II helicase)
MRDLEIRGAGNILGAEQHGHMDKIGYELYSKLLREELSGQEEVVPELDIRVTAFIPDEYIDGNVAKMDAYKEIAEINSLVAEKEFRRLIEDNYGKIPEETDNLINIAVVKSLAMKFAVKEINVRMSDVNLVFNDFKAFANEKLSRALEEFKEVACIVMTTAPMIEFKRENQSSREMLKLIKEFFAFATQN